MGAVAVLLEQPRAGGPVNLVCPQPATNAEFTRALAERVHRPALAAVPAQLLRVAAGAMAPELLGSVRAVPKALSEWGYRFADPDVGAVLDTGLAARS